MGAHPAGTRMGWLCSDQQWCSRSGILAAPSVVETQAGVALLLASKLIVMYDMFLWICSPKTRVLHAVEVLQATSLERY